MREVSVVAGLLLMALGYAVLGCTPAELARAPPFLPAVRAGDSWRSSKNCIISVAAIDV